LHLALELAAVLPEPPVRGSDERVEGTILHVWHVPNGIGLEAWVYSDREEALEAVGLRE